MDKKKSTMSACKWVAVLLHLTCMVLAIIGVGKVYHNDNYGKGLDWLKITRYEETDEFAAQLQTDVNLIFEYVKYRDILEKDGQLDLSVEMVELTYAPGDDRYYDLTELINYGKAHGLYLDDNYMVRKDPVPVMGDEYAVLWRSYAEDIVGTEPGSESASMYELAEEALNILSSYYRVNNLLNSKNTNMYYKIVYQEFYGKQVTSFSNIPTESEAVDNLDDEDDFILNMQKHLKVTGENSLVETNLKTPPSNLASMLESSNMNNNNDYYMILGVDTAFPKEDAYQANAKAFLANRQDFIDGLWMSVIGFLVCLLTLIFMLRQTGREEFGGEIILSGLDNAATELGLLVWAGFSLLVLYLVRDYGAKLIRLVMLKDNWPYGERMVGMSAAYICALVGGLSAYRRYRSDRLWKNSLIRRVGIHFKEYVTHKNETFKMAAMYGVYILLNLAFAAAAHWALLNVGTGWGTAVLIILGFGWILFSLWVFHLLFRKAVQEDEIGEALSRISGGDTTFQMELSNFNGKPRVLAEEINHISEGLEKALKEQVKSERLKTDLITNVSHDIKTPLTSIINYVDLIKREKIQDPKILSYLAVLEQKSQRLKNLTEDLVEASKASSGNLNLEISDIDFVELVNQTNGEFEEKFETRNLSLVMNLPEEAAVIKADGRRLWRVLENLYNNAYKYAMPGSRVYVDVTIENGQAVFIMKNVSENPLNIHAEDLTERFVRGDVARTTEGSGLGLSIAKSLTELQKGRFTLTIDGDLFKACISFPLV